MPNICKTCAQKSGVNLSELSVGDHETYCKTHSFMSEQCPICSSVDVIEYFDIMDSYIPGHGYADKVGTAIGMDRHKLILDDPYASSRVSGEKDELIRKLDSKTRFNPNKKNI